MRVRDDCYNFILSKGMGSVNRNLCSAFRHFLCFALLFLFFPRSSTLFVLPGTLLKPMWKHGGSRSTSLHRRMIMRFMLPVKSAAALRKYRYAGRPCDGNIKPGLSFQEKESESTQPSKGFFDGCVRFSYPLFRTELSSFFAHTAGRTAETIHLIVGADLGRYIRVIRRRRS